MSGDHAPAIRELERYILIKCLIASRNILKKAFLADMISRFKDSLRVVINCQILPNSGAGGLETFSTALIHALGHLEDGPEEYVIVGPWQDPDWMEASLGPNQRIVRGPLVPSMLRWLHSYLSRLSAIRRIWAGVPKSSGFYERLGCDVIHFPYQEFVICDLPSVYNPHDLQHLYYPQYFKPSEFAARDAMYRAGCLFAHTIGVSSRWVKGDIVKHYDEDPAKIQVIPGGPLNQACAEPTPDALTAVKEKYRLDEPFALYPSMTWQHKNHIRLLEALALLRDRDHMKFRLVCTGYKGSFWPHIKERLFSLGLQEQVSFLGMIPSEELRALYRLTQFVVIPTLFEATSGPLLEAWQDGAPAACSSVTALPEQAMDAALIFDPHSVESIAEAIVQIASRSDLRDDLRKRGTRRLQDFSWERTARAYRAVYRRAAGCLLSEEDRWLLSWDWMREPQRENGVKP